MPPGRRVVLLVETSRQYGRGLLRGIARYVSEHGPWSVYHTPHGLDDPPPKWLRGWSGDGVLARVGDARLATLLRGLGVPAIDLRGLLPDAGLPFLGVDNRATADLAADHLLERGLRQFGFCGVPRRTHRLLDERQDYFVARLARAGYGCAVYAGGGTGVWDADQERLAAWVRGLPKPAGVMTCHDDRGQQVLDACRRAGVRVPDEVAVVSVDDDELLCALSDPPLTSVDVNSVQIGYEAAALLDRLMAGQPPPAGPVLFPPRRVITRRSTDLLAVDDPLVAAALRFIREHACEGVRVHEVLKAVPLSRSSLERRFQQLLGRTPKAEILRVQLEHVKRLLVDTDLSLEAIARRCGFADAKYLGAVFRHRAGVTPGAYRRRLRKP